MPVLIRRIGLIDACLQLVLEGLRYHATRWALKIVWGHEELPVQRLCLFEVTRQPAEQVV
jgi:hypothetical protein